jgi:DNA-binding IclR family transcriptional regulator
LVQRIRAEYVEMPGLSLTISQAARFWGLNATALEVLLSTLVDTGFLVCDGKGLYRRRV